MASHPGPAFAVAHPAHFIALGFGVGTLPRAPGTFGTLLALPLWWLLGAGVGPLAIGAILGLLFAIGVWACAVTGRHLGVADHGAMVWDEVVAFLLVLSIVPDDGSWQLAAFVLFRAFDIAKPAPIRQLETRFKGGFGVMFDDLLAAGYTLLVLAVFQRVLF
ncbi:MAG: phosphatidylglycerophosphatase [Betaproteobacteria bacterium SG8_39]|nr:MAG: phosphatidylglycerophosphatase [Betaproteobacteria bacterium SG8_39]